MFIVGAVNNFGVINKLEAIQRYVGGVNGNSKFWNLTKSRSFRKEKFHDDELIRRKRAL